MERCITRKMHRIYDKIVRYKTLFVCYTISVRDAIVRKKTPMAAPKLTLVQEDFTHLDQHLSKKYNLYIRALSISSNIFTLSLAGVEESKGVLTLCFYPKTQNIVVVGSWGDQYFDFIKSTNHRVPTEFRQIATLIRSSTAVFVKIARQLKDNPIQGVN